MTLLINQILSAILQISLFTAIPFITWLITSRTRQTFTSYIGLYSIPKQNRSKAIILSLGVSILLLATAWLSSFLIGSTPTAANTFSNLGLSGIPPAIVYSLFTTALSEEILFRGFILKRIKAKLNFRFANLIQAIIFGILHGALLITLTSLFNTVLVIAFTSLAAWLLGYINEHYGNGSIVPSILSHSVVNFITCLFFIF